ncbi:4Fe-4S ferredoxin iron-sulfur binding domain protein [Stanieria cyanosphaera PCC 7437]|uniref:4Fe-4S ferredoxin iron-sulfur binding domain protein n=1 Tax=Stanieria cyanosphaera (strain ATCC 29371 / PCC 7437) TaxID=111780 RepID=K9XPA7_STAC7|nr:LdpA C-terminal domain-containing domain [Stanieria cyanosphaera]AFZ33924.1 4Fe-4S ferredoxin iron-sulfur binding domain protein [Stanieria cyanosphaera PCC 7437]
MSNLYHPLHSLKEGHWFKLICGASFQHLPAIRSLALAYSLAGADCIDVAADPAVIAAAREGIEVAASLAQTNNFSDCFWRGKPWLMVSLNDGEDPHFRKAEFESTNCPAECPRPCEVVCPAKAITFAETPTGFSGVIDRLCYGCGRCLPICPPQIISTRAYVSTPNAIADWLPEVAIDAIEIHTQVGHYNDFQRLWRAIANQISNLKVLAISCPDHPDLIDYLQALYNLISPLPCPLIWQTDGRPMSGDIGIGTTHAAIKLAQKVLTANLPGFVQLAGGTNGYTVTKLRTAGLINQANNQAIAGIAYGSYARSLLSPILEQLEIINQQNFKSNSNSLNTMKVSFEQLENQPEFLKQAVNQACSLVSQIKTNVKSDYFYDCQASKKIKPMID